MKYKAITDYREAERNFYVAKLKRDFQGCLFVYDDNFKDNASSITTWMLLSI